MHEVNECMCVFHKMCRWHQEIALDIPTQTSWHLTRKCTMMLREACVLLCKTLGGLTYILKRRVTSWKARGGEICCDISWVTTKIWAGRGTFLWNSSASEGLLLSKHIGTKANRNGILRLYVFTSKIFSLCWEYFHRVGSKDLELWTNCIISICKTNAEQKNCTISRHRLWRLWRIKHPVW